MDWRFDEDLARAAESLQSADAAVRRVAVLALADSGDEAALPLILQALRDADGSVRAEAARMLEGWEQPEVITALISSLRDGDTAVGRAAADSLAQLKDSAAAPLLADALAVELAASNSDGFVKASLLQALRELRSPAAAELALQALRDADATVRRAAVGVLGWLKWPPALPVLGSLLRADPDIDVRRAVAGALSFGAADEVLNALCAALADRAWQVREEAATSLAKVALAVADQSPTASAAAQSLIHALGDDYWQVRLRAARSLGRIKARQAWQPLVALLQHSISNLRKEAALALGELGELQARDALLQAERDSDPEVRKAVRIALAQLQLS